MAEATPLFAPNPPQAIGAFLNGPAALAGAPVYVDPGHTGGMLLSLAVADGAVYEANAIGLLVAPSVGGDGPCNFMPVGPLELGAQQWDAITGETGGLVPGDWYYVSDVTPGKLTNVAPSTATHYVAPMGHALSTTVLVVTRSIAVVVP